VSLVGKGHCVVGVETPESCTQVYITWDGVLEVHVNVVFEANTAVSSGGAVSLCFDTAVLLLAVVLCDRFCEGWFDTLTQLTKPRQKG